MSVTTKHYGKVERPGPGGSGAVVGGRPGGRPRQGGLGCGTGQPRRQRRSQLRGDARLVGRPVVPAHAQPLLPRSRPERWETREGRGSWMGRVEVWAEGAGAGGWMSSRSATDRGAWVASPTTIGGTTSGGNGRAGR